MQFYTCIRQIYYTYLQHDKKNVSRYADSLKYQFLIESGRV